MSGLWSSLSESATAPDWARHAQRILAERLLDTTTTTTDYPCHFGVRGQRDGTNCFTAVEPGSSGSTGVDGLVESLLAYRRKVWTGPRRQTLIAFVGPPEPNPSLAGHTDLFWSLLGRLSERDPDPWPPERTCDVTDPKWQWCFTGEPWFVFGASPAYTRRRSRNLGPCLTMFFQVLEVFDGLDTMSVAGESAKDLVRRRLLAYDDVGPHPHNGDTLHIPPYKWREYMLPDGDELLASDGCPFDPSKVRR